MTDPNSREEKKRNNRRGENEKGRDDREPGGQVGKDKSPDRQPDLQGDSSQGRRGVPPKDQGEQKDTKRR